MKLARAVGIFAAIIGLGACSQPAPDVKDEPTAKVTQPVKITAKNIRAALENKGLECAKQKQLPNGVVAATECRRSDPALVFITMQKFADAKQLEDAWDETGSFLCTEELTSGQAWGVSGKWALVAGGYNDEHRSLLKEVSAELDFKLKEADCEEFA